jgi:tetratricopeptide (TPR) repeat protein
MSRPTRTYSVWARIKSALHFWSARAHRHYGIVYADQQEFADAIDDYTRAVTVNPALRRAYLERGILYWRELNHPRRAIADLTAALELQPGWPEALFCRGMAYEAAGDYPAAIQDFTGYVRSNDYTWRESAQSQLALLQSLMGEALPVGDTA